MSSWGNKDFANNAPKWAVASVPNTVANSTARATAANVAYLYQNTSPNVYTTGVTIGLWNVSQAEEAVAVNGVNPSAGPAHDGWVLKTVGQGGRAGRIQYETLVILANTPYESAAGQNLFPDTAITFVQPSTVQSIVHGGGNTITISVSGTTVIPSSASVTYLWQYNNQSGGGWNNVTANTSNAATTGNTTVTLVVTPSDTSTNNFVYRVLANATNPGVVGSNTTTFTSSNSRTLVS